MPPHEPPRILSLPRTRSRRYHRGQSHGVHVGLVREAWRQAVEAQASEAQKKIQGLVESTSLNAPAGSDTAVTAMKSAVAAASNAMESVQKSVKQATELMESNFKAVTSNVANAAKPAAKKR